MKNLKMQEDFMNISVHFLEIFVSSLFFLLQTPALSAQESAAPRSAATTAAAAEPQAAGQIVSSPSQLVPALPVPRLIKFSVVVKDAMGQRRSGVVGITFSIYAGQQGGATLRLETQDAALDAQGRYAVLLGSTQNAGLPLDLFATGEPRWLGAKLELPGEVEQPRVLLVSVPYALKASDADTVGGMPASAFVLAPTGSGSGAGAGASAPGSTKSTAGKSKAEPLFTSSGTTNYIPIFTDSTGDIGNSTIYQSTSGNVGIGFSNPQQRLVIGAPAGGIVLNSTNLSDQDLNVIVSAPGATDKHTFFGPSTNTNLTLGVGGVEKVRINNAGNVGIGYSNPQQRLVIGAPAGGTVLNATNLSDQDLQVNVTAPGASDKHTYFGPSVATNLTLGVGRLEMMRITNSGFVGINTKTPRSILEADVSNAGGLGPTVTLTNTGGGTNAAASLDFNSYPPSSSGTYNPAARIEAVDAGTFSDGILFQSNVPGAANHGLQTNMNILASGYITMGGGYFFDQLGVFQASSYLSTCPSCPSDALGAYGWSAPSGSNLNGNEAIYAEGGEGDLSDSSSHGGDGIFAYTKGGGAGQTGSYAGYFSGNVDVTGTLAKGGGSFKIDHPLDPANKYLYHSFVESPDMMNIYNGNVTTDSQGTAVVTLPDWFETLNRDFRYQLTVIGQFAQAIVAGEIANHQFSIQTDKPNVKVSWQVTGVRQDAWANAHRIPVEVEKNAQERGYYIHPELYGASEQQSIAWARHPAMMKMKQEMRAGQLASAQKQAATNRAETLPLFVPPGLKNTRPPALSTPAQKPAAPLQ